MKRVILVLGLVLLVFAGAWYFGLRNNFNQRFPDGWEWNVHTLGQTSFADASTGTFPEGTSIEDDPINNTERLVSAENIGNGLVQISDHYETRDPVTDAVTWEFTYEATVDAKTGQYPDGEFAGEYYLLPQNLQPEGSYTLRNTTYQGIEVSFQREEVINGVNTYLFAFYGDLNNTVANEAYVTLEEGQSVVCFDFELEYWVEPNTGEIVKYREWCEGDWVVDANGERLYAISRWGGETDGADLIRQASVVQSTLFRHQAINLYLPGIAAVLGALFLLFGLIPSQNPAEKKAAV